jgi:hypothetical protein
VSIRFDSGGYKLRRILSFMMFIFPILHCNSLFPQDTGMNASRQSSAEAFREGDYERAYSGFSELLQSYPKDPLYKYYSGVCLVRLSRNPEEAEKLLEEARAGATVARIVPADAIYWQARAMQLSGKYDEAVNLYNSFTEQAGKKAARDLNVSEYIRQCNDGKGQLSLSGPVTSQPVIENSSEASKPKIKEALPLSGTKEGHKVDTLSENYDGMLTNALGFQVKADSLYCIVDNLKNNSYASDLKTKAELKSRIKETEKLADSLQGIADKGYAEAQACMNVKPFAQVASASQKASVANDSSVNMHKIFSKAGTRPGIEAGINQDSLKVAKNTMLQAAPVKNNDMQEVHDTVSKPVAKSLRTEAPEKAPGIYEVFEAGTEKPSAAGRILIDQALPSGLVYMVQIAVFRNQVSQSYFRGITPIYGFKVDGTDNTSYRAGMFRRLSDAGKALLIVRKKGFSDAFVIALFDGKAVSSERAALLEKEWGKKPFPQVVKSSDLAPTDTLPPTLSFRVEVMRSAKPVKNDILEGMRKLAGGRGLDTEILKDGTLVYLLGQFITFDSAEEYAGLLVKNGYSDAKVVARLGTKDIPIDKARELFEKP